MAASHVKQPVTTASSPEALCYFPPCFLEQGEMVAGKLLVMDGKDIVFNREA